MLVEGAGFGERLGDERLVEDCAALDRPPVRRSRSSRRRRVPPVAARPRKLPVTQIERWLRDPYALYARQILKLKPLDAIDEAPAAAERGTMIHDALDKFVKMYPKRFARRDEEALAALIALRARGVRRFAAAARRARLLVAALRADCALVPRLRTRAARGAPSRSWPSRRARSRSPRPAGAFTLTATADRIEMLAGRCDRRSPTTRPGGVPIVASR